MPGGHNMPCQTKEVRARMPTKREALNDGNGAQMHKKETRVAVRPEKNY